MTPSEKIFPKVYPKQSELPNIWKVDLPDISKPGVGKLYHKNVIKNNPIRVWHVVTSFNPSEHELSKEKNKIKVLDFNHAPKLNTVLDYIKTYPIDQKIIIIANKDAGFHAMVHLLNENNISVIGLYRGSEPDKISEPKHRDLGMRGYNGLVYFNEKKIFNKTSEKTLKKFNNDKKVKFRVIVLNSDLYSEGISVKNASLTINLTTFKNWSEYRQAFGRGVRSCGHVALPYEKRNMTLIHFLARAIPDSDESYKITPDEEAFDNVKMQRDIIENNLNSLETIAIDSNFYQNEYEPPKKKKKKKIKNEPIQQSYLYRFFEKYFSWINR